LHFHDAEVEWNGIDYLQSHEQQLLTNLASESSTTHSYGHTERITMQHRATRKKLKDDCGAVDTLFQMADVSKSLDATDPRVTKVCMSRFLQI
jgi:hypothetical protein